MITLAYKLPLGSLTLLAASAVFWLVRLRWLRPGELAPLVPAIALIGLLCTQTGLNWALRYALPALPYLLVAAGGFVRVAWTFRIGKFGLMACLLWNLVAVLGIHPFYLSYGSELVGGPAGASREFIGSNYDWGQDLMRLKDWSDSHAYATPLVLAYYGPMGPQIIGLPHRGLPADLIDAGRPIDGPRPMNRAPYFCAVSESYLNGLAGPMEIETGGQVFGVFRLPPGVDPSKPHARIGYSILVYRIVPKDRSNP